MMIVYLHGFRSSPASAKAQMLAHKVQKAGLEWYCPQLAASPKDSVEMVMAHIAATASEDVAIVGASLGGLYAAWIAEQVGCRAVLVNPVVAVPKHAARFCAYKTDFAGRPFHFKEAYLAELARYVSGQVTHPERYLLLASSDDEVLDVHQMQSHFAQSKQIIVQGDNHRMEQFDDYLDEVLQFCLNKGAQC